MGIILSLRQNSGAMGRQNNIQKAMKFIQQELQIMPGAQTVQPIDEATTPFEMTCTPSGCVIDFFAAREWLQTGFKERDHTFKIKRKAARLASQRILSVERGDRLEESLYWLLSAATLMYFLLGIIGG